MLPAHGPDDAAVSKDPDFNELTLRILRREGLMSAAQKAGREAERCGALLKDGKLAPAAHEHIAGMQRAYIDAHDKLLREAAS